MDHKYYIVRCYNTDYELNYTYLKKHLKNLNVLPDENAIDIIKILDVEEFNKKKKILIHIVYIKILEIFLILIKIY